MKNHPLLVLYFLVMAFIGFVAVANVVLIMAAAIKYLFFG